MENAALKTNRIYEFKLQMCIDKKSEWWKVVDRVYVRPINTMYSLSSVSSQPML